MSDPIYVTKPFLPPLGEFNKYLERIWQNNILTNSGPLHQELEAKLCDYLGVEYISLFSSATAGLFASFPVLGIDEGEVITTAFTFVATAHSIIWNNLTPVFVDIDPATANIDPQLIEAAITDKTKAILAVHCYGQTCDVHALDAIAKKYNIKVIYDAAHAFAVKDEGGTILRHGDLSVLSFHATKVFNTFEGGAIICHDKETKTKIDQFKNFGFISDGDINAIGFNGKMSEVNAAMGLLQLKYVDEAIAKRKKIAEKYNYLFETVKGITPLSFDNLKQANYSYSPVIVENDFRLTRDELFNALKEKNIFARKYFFPSINNFTPYKSYKAHLPKTENMASCVICLPIYPDMTDDEFNRIADCFRN